jgi:hypothetical protein
MSKNVHSTATTAGSNSPNKRADLNNGIWRRLMQLYLKFAQNFQENQVPRYTKASNKEIFEHNSLIFPRIWNGLHAGRPGKPFRKVARRILERHVTSSSDFLLPEITAHASKGSLHSNFHTTTIIGGISAVAGVFGWILLTRPNILLRSSLRRSDNLIINNRHVQLFCRRPPLLHADIIRIF